MRHLSRISLSVSLPISPLGVCLENVTRSGRVVVHLQPAVRLEPRDPLSLVARYRENTGIGHGVSSSGSFNPGNKLRSRGYGLKSYRTTVAPPKPRRRLRAGRAREREVLIVSSVPHLFPPKRVDDVERGGRQAFREEEQISFIIPSLALSASTSAAAIYKPSNSIHSSWLVTPSVSPLKGWRPPPEM